MSATKVCKKCGKELPTTEFYNNRANKDGLSDYCRECTKAYNKEHCNKATKAKTIKEEPARVSSVVKETVNNFLNKKPEAEKVITPYTLSEVATVELIKELRSRNIPVLVNYTPVDLMQKLVKLGYLGKLVYYEKKEIDLSRFEPEVKSATV